MKKLILIFFSTVFFFACSESESTTTKGKAAQTTETSSPIRMPVSAVEEVDTDVLPKMTFESLEYDFGVVREGKKVEHVFEFENTGEEPLLIGEANSTCGCTVPEFPKDYIQPGKKGKIKVIFDSKNLEGKVTKPITLIANTYPRETKLHIKGVVKKKHKH